MTGLNVLQERGFIEAITNKNDLKQYLIGEEKAACYIGFDPTAPSLHVGNLVCIMALAHMQRSGHRAIALLGGGTGLIGDPSGKTEMRKVITQNKINENKKGIRKQLQRFIDFSDDSALLIDNADWLLGIKYIPFLRDIGRYFSINKMIKAESYKIRINSEEGLNFIEFNYMLLQAYDFMQLSNTYNCMLQMGGSDQWGNIVAGIDLIRRTQRKKAFGVTFPLITTSSGIKMGKTHKGAIWLDSKSTSSYDYYQFWINTDDADVEKFLALFTFLPMKEINAVKTFTGSELNQAKVILAFEATRIAHGHNEAEKAFKSSASVFGSPVVSKSFMPSSNIPRNNSILGLDESIPSLILNKKKLENGGINAVELFAQTDIFKSKSEVRRILSQGGGYINGKRVLDFNQIISTKNIRNGKILLRVGKKKYYKIIIKKIDKIK
ncbi:MAG: tyrosine--tRNA ligase [Desulfobacteraceae bacterium 4572_130]|nr:MAG: tyrosine--tRNA ligase [Desulfobacteraceae bacterium 4572_130]